MPRLLIGIEAPAGAGKGDRFCEEAPRAPDHLPSWIASLATPHPFSALMERRVDFIAVDNPTATKFTVHTLAAVAELSATP
jgi:hypothetical protein